MFIRITFGLCAIMMTVALTPHTGYAQEKPALQEKDFEKTDTNKSGSIGLEEFRGRMIVVFKALDLDKDDFIELAEVPSERRYVFPDVDSDNNGRVDRTEFIAYAIPRFKESDTNKDGLLTPEEAEAADQLERETNAPSAFELTDRNGDGQVDKKEYRVRMMVVFEILDADEDGLIEIPEVPDGADVDSDGNGGVDRTEFIAYTFPRFRASDINKDGSLTPEEVEAANQLEYETNAPSAFDLTDQNGDGEVDKEEYRVRMLVVFEILDADEDGLIELPEVPDGHKQSFPVADTDGKPGVNLDEHLAFARSLFERADTDKDGVLTPGEVQSANERAGVSAVK